MIRTLTTLVAISVGAAGLAACDRCKPHEPQHGDVKVTTLAARDIVEKLDGKKTKATFLEVTLEPGQADVPHRHAGPVFGYVLAGDTRVLAVILHPSVAKQVTIPEANHK